MPLSKHDRIYVGPLPIAEGLNTSRDPLLISDGEASLLRNFEVNEGTLNNRKGLTEYASFSSTVASGNRDKAWNGLDKVEFEDGTRFIVTANSEKLFNYDGSAWNDLVPATTVPANGGDLLPWDICFGLDADGFGNNGTVFFCNGADPIYYWDPDEATPVDDLIAHASYSGGPTSKFYARYCVVYGGRLVVGYTSEGATPDVYSFRTRASAINNFLEFDTTAGAQAVDHGDTPGEITGLAVQTGQLYVLKRDAIIIGQETGDPNAPLVYPTLLKTGCLSGRTFQAVSPLDSIFLGEDNVYAIRGGDVRPVGDPIRRELFKNLNYSRLRQAFAFVDKSKGFYYLAVPTAEEDYASTLYVYNWNDGAWFKEKYDVPLHSATFEDLGSATTIADLTSALSTYSSTAIGDWGAGINAPQLLVGSRQSSDHRIYTRSNDNVDIIDDFRPEWYSKDFRPNPEGESELKSVIVYYQGSNISSSQGVISVSTDRGKTYSDAQTSNMSNTGTRMIFNMRVSGLYHRIKFQLRVPKAGVDDIKIQLVELAFTVRQELR